MENIVGQIPRGKDFFKRDKIVKKIYRRLDAGNNVFLSAPRRAGKTSIMRYMEDNPKKGYVFIYINVEDAESTEDYFRILGEELLNSKAIGSLLKQSEKAQSAFKSFTDKIKKIKLFNVEIETKEVIPFSYREEFDQLMKDIDEDQFKIILLIDEFPIAVEQIAKKIDNAAAVNFLHINRGLRQRAKKGIQFIYTGSIGLPNIAGKLDATLTVNDLNIVEVPPLTKMEGVEFAKRIFDHYKIQYEEAIIIAMLEEIKWLMPFFIQLIAYEGTTENISLQKVREVIDKASNHRNNIYFKNYYSRIKKSLTKAESDLALHILSTVAAKNEVPANSFKEQANAVSILEILEFDGYINEYQGKYRFNSPILQRWWKKYARS